MLNKLSLKASARQLRGAILRELLKKPATLKQLQKNLSQIRKLAEREVESEVERMTKENLDCPPPKSPCDFRLAYFDFLDFRFKNNIYKSHIFPSERRTSL